MEGSDFLTLAFILVFAVAGVLIVSSVISSVIKKKKAKQAAEQKDVSEDR